MLAKFIIRITVLGLPKDIRQKYLRAWLAELEQINQEAPKECWAFATSLFWNIPKMRKIETKKSPTIRKTVGRLLLTSSTIAAVLVILVQWSSPPTPIFPKPNQGKLQDTLDSVKAEENNLGPINEIASDVEDNLSVLGRAEALESDEELPSLSADTGIAAKPSAPSLEELEVVVPTKPDIRANGSFARATISNEESEEEPLSEMTTPVPPPAITQTSPESHARSPVSGYTSIEQEQANEEIFPEGPSALSDLELDLGYMFDSVQSESETSDEGIPTEEPTTTSNIEALEMTGVRDDLELGANQDSQDTLSGIQSQPENREEALAEEFFALEANPLERQLEDTDGQVLSVGEAKQKEMALEESLRKLAQGYLVSKKISEKEAAEFVEILSELLELDKKTTKNYLDDLLRQIR